MKTCGSQGCPNPKPARGTLCGPCRNLRQRYNLTVPERERLLEAQGRKCALCEQPIKFDGTAKQYSACIDHDHQTKRVRGVLCGNCNTWLGYFESKIDDAEKLKRYTSS